MRETWRGSQTRSDEHSTKEVEHRFTSLESFAETSKSDRSALHLIVAKHSEKLTFHERVLIAVCVSVGTLLQDKFPAVAHALKMLITGK